MKDVIQLSTNLDGGDTEVKKTESLPSPIYILVVGNRHKQIIIKCQRVGICKSIDRK